MAQKCSDTNALINLIVNVYNHMPDNSDMTKVIFRIDGLICSIFKNGTVQFQGQPGTVVQNFIEASILSINSKS